MIAEEDSIDGIVVVKECGRVASHGRPTVQNSQIPQSLRRSMGMGIFGQIPEALQRGKSGGGKLRVITLKHLCHEKTLPSMFLEAVTWWRRDARRYGAGDGLELAVRRVSSPSRTT